MNRAQRIADLLLESANDAPKDRPLPVVHATRPEPYMVCPHCHKEIYEKHTYIDGDFMSGNYIERHSDCGGAIKFPEPDPASIPDWLKPHMPK